MTTHLIRCGMSIAMLLCSLVSDAQTKRRLPSVAIKMLNGKAIDVSTISNGGKPIIVFVWEITCQPCIAELNAMARHYAGWKKETGVTIVAISVDDSRSSPRITPLVRSKGWDFEVYLDPNQAFKRAMNVGYCPYAFVLDGKGEVVWQKGGYTPGDENIIFDIVQKAVNGEPIN